MNLLQSYFYNKFIKKTDKWFPLMAFYYLTNDCNFRCIYCHSGPFLIGEAKHFKPVLSGHDVINAVRVIRNYTGTIALTGGEPLFHPDFEYIAEKISDLHFANVILATNGYYIDKYFSSIVSSFDSVCISLDTLHEKKADAFFAAGKGAFKKVKENIERLSQHPAMKDKISISSVITPGGIEDLYDVFEYAQGLGLEFAAAPQLVGVKAHGDLVDNSDYKRFIDFLITNKKRGHRIFGTVRYLEYMRDFKKFQCYPLVILVVSPKGDIFYPCLERGRAVANVLENSNLHEILTVARTSYGKLPECDNRCHSACMMGFSLALKYPQSMFYETYLQLKSGNAFYRKLLFSRK